MLFDNRRDAMSRLEGTIIFHQGRAVYVRGIDERIRIHATRILDREELVFKQDDEGVSLACPPVGYVNLTEEALFFMRQPVRRWKQGLDMRALVCPGAGIRARGAIDDVSLAKCLENIYPSLPEALESFGGLNPFKTNERNAIAFSRNFCVRRSGKGPLLCYKGKEVGVVEQGNPVLSTKYQWLQESLEAAL